jgi:uncharacterized protein YbaP (TraB family)
MKNKITTYLLCLLPFLSCSSDLNKVAEDNGIVDIEVKNGNTLLWKIEGKNSKPSYLFGTMHMINEEFYHFSNNLTQRIVASEAIIMEMGGMPNPLTTFQAMSLDSGKVHDYFTKDQLIELLAFMDTVMGISPQEFDQTYGAMKPFFILQTLSQNYFDASAKSYDLTIMSLAAEKNIPLIGLETIEEQLGFFDEIPMASMAEMILETIRNQEEEKENTLKLMEFYSKEKVDKLIPLLEKQSVEIMNFEDVFLYNRNKAWVPKIEKEIKNKACFVAVGAAHLFGKKGLIELLRAAGYTLTPISSK